MPSLEFKGKAFVYSHHLSVPFRELTVQPEKSLLGSGETPGTDGNLIIHGDNLEALKALLPVYAGKVDCIYIDPPYNTGNEGWCYNDNVRSPLMREWLKKSANPVEKEDLERHDKWLCMIWPRLQLLRELLAEDGMIFVSIDDNEAHRLRILFDEIFGEDNFIACIEWVKRYTRSNNARMFYSQRDHTLVYRKSGALNIIKEPRTEKADASYSNSDNDERGPWMTSSYVNPATKEQRKNLVYPITRPKDGRRIEHPTHAWKYELAEHVRHIDERRLWWGADGLAEYPRLKLFLQEADLLVPVDVWSYQEVGSSDDGGEILKQIFGSNVFDNPKPVKLIEKIIGLSNKKNALVLDSFAGSGTTGHAVLAMNKKDGGNRRFILVELEEYADKLTAERVRRVAQGYDFTGIQRIELFREKLNLTRLRKAAELVDKAESIAQLEGSGFDAVKTSVEDGALVVTGERQVKGTAPGLGGSFTFCTLGAPMTLEALLADGLPSYESLARYVFFTATGRTISTLPPKQDRVEGFIGESDVYRVHLLYEANTAWLASDAAALTEAQAERIASENVDRKTALVFAAAKFLSQRELTRNGITFCQLPYAIHRLLGD